MAIDNTFETTLDRRQIDSSTPQKQLLRDTIKGSLQDYLSKLGGTIVNNVYDLVLKEVELPLLEAVMGYTRGNQSKAAILLGLSRGTLRKKLKIYGFID